MSYHRLHRCARMIRVFVCARRCPLWLLCETEAGKNVKKDIKENSSFNSPSTPGNIMLMPSFLGGTKIRIVHSTRHNLLFLRNP